MKKIVCIAAALVLACCFSVSAFAANTELLTFDSAENAKTYIGSTEDFMNSTYGTAIPEYSSVTGVNGNALKLSMTVTTTTVFTAVIGDTDAITAFRENCGSKKYLRFWFENVSEKSDITIALNFRADGGNKYVNAAADELGFYDKDGNALTPVGYFDPSGGAAGERNFSAVVSAGFKGWVYFELDNSKLAALTGWGKTGLGSLSEVENIELDVRLYDNKGDNYIAFVFDSLELTDELVEGERDTADFSVIAYALAAITGCGALVVARKRK